MVEASALQLQCTVTCYLPDPVSDPHMHRILVAMAEVQKVVSSQFQRLFATEISTIFQKILNLPLYHSASSLMLGKMLGYSWSK